MNGSALFVHYLPTEVVALWYLQIVAHFTASWCIPSVFMNSFFEDLASSYKDALFLIVDVDEVKEVARRLKVKAMPTFMFLKDGNTMDKLVGANPDEIKKRVDGFVQSSRLEKSPSPSLSASQQEIMPEKKPKSWGLIDWDQRSWAGFMSSLSRYYRHYENNKRTGRIIGPLAIKWNCLCESKMKANVVVAKDGTGKYKTVNEAVLAAPENSNSRYVIYVKKGVYKETIDIGKKKKNLMLVGDGKDVTIITGSLNVVDGSTTFRSATVAANGDGFMAQDIWFQNTAGPAKHQAVALRVSADQSVINRCRIDAYQDTLYTHTLRQFYRDSFITGTVDFIFGNSAVVFQNCDIVARKPGAGQKNMLTAQGREDPNQNTAISFQKCRLTASSDLAPVKGSVKTFLGRPWKLYSRTVIMQSFIDNHIDPAGWFPWDGDFALSTLYYGEYANNGPGADTSKRVKWKGFKVIRDSKEADKFTVAKLIQGGLWLKPTGVAVAHTIGHVAATVSMSKVAVSFTHIIKSGEPAFSVLVSRLFLGETFPLPVYLSLLPIIGGCALAAVTELNFNMIGFMGAMISNLAFVFRNIFSKKGMKGKSVSGMNYYACLSMMSLLLVTPFAIAVEGPQMWAAGWQNAVSEIGPNFVWWVVAQSVFYHLYNQVSYMSLDQITPLTFSVGNTMKRISVIVASIIIFHTPIRPVNSLGAAIAILGTFIYSQAKQ
ncbi:hypothetical protein F2Q69_00063519 [Brassica cretica]|uniref:Pectinesterase n=1 Tax=Brassica cretica TaxID=69181 RepID=A0A8S9RKR1_BRACR|nr:hypothetical protein F2Q69_00063519 [Brassica cretica]